MCAGFDLGGCRTYDTRPMPDDGSKLRDISILADEGAELAVEISVAHLTRLVHELAAPTGTAVARVQFSRERGFAVAQVQAQAQVELICQRCLQPLQVAIRSDSRVFLLHAEADAERVPADVETMLAPEGRLRMDELVAEELLLALPLAPLHSEEQLCAARSDDDSDRPPDEEVQRPFAALGDLMSQAGRNEPMRPNKRR